MPIVDDCKYQIRLLLFLPVTDPAHICSNIFYINFNHKTNIRTLVKVPLSKFQQSSPPIEILFTGGELIKMISETGNRESTQVYDSVAENS